MMVLKRLMAVCVLVGCGGVGVVGEEGEDSEGINQETDRLSVLCGPDETEFPQYGLTNYAMTTGGCWSPEYGRNSCNIKDAYTPSNCILGRVYEIATRTTNAKKGWEVWYRCCPLPHNSVEFARVKTKLTDSELTQAIEKLTELIDAKNSGVSTSTVITIASVVAEVFRWAKFGKMMVWAAFGDWIAQHFTTERLENIKEMYRKAQVDLLRARVTYAVIGQQYRVDSPMDKSLPEQVTEFLGPYFIGIE